MNRRTKNYAFVVAVIVGITLVACGGETSSSPASAAPTSAPEPTVEAAAASTSVPLDPTAAPASSENGNALKSDIIDFTLEDLTIQVGTTVTWVNLDAPSHTTTAGVSPDRSNEWDSGSLSSASEFSFTFNEIGTISYFCTIHPSMTATVTVVALGSSAETPTPAPIASTSTPVPPSPTAQVATQTPAPAEPTLTPEPTAITSEILNFELEDLTIAAGTTVTWINGDSALHTTTAGVSPTRSGEWDSKTLSQGAQFSFTFQETGSFPYFCTIHETMTATITVAESTSQTLNNDDY